MECDVVGLPLERRLAGVHGRRDLVVNRHAVVVLDLRTVRVEHLRALVIAGQVDSAVAPGLAMGVREVRDIELDVDLKFPKAFSVMTSPWPAVIIPSANDQFVGVLPSD